MVSRGSVDTRWCGHLLVLVRQREGSRRKKSLQSNHPKMNLVNRIAVRILHRLVKEIGFRFESLSINGILSIQLYDFVRSERFNFLILQSQDLSQYLSCVLPKLR